MPHQIVTSVDGGSAEYWRQRVEGFRLIQDAEDCVKRIETAPP